MGATADLFDQPALIDVVGPGTDGPRWYPVFWNRAIWYLDEAAARWEYGKRYGGRPESARILNFGGLAEWWLDASVGGWRDRVRKGEEWRQIREQPSQ